jgi:sugar lactone lactonase YvrE
VLQDANAGPDAVAQRVEKVVIAEPVDGLWLDAQGRFYLSAFQDNAVKVLTPDGKTRPWAGRAPALARHLRTRA